MNERKMCRWALISWPIENKTPEKLFIILGEFYDTKTQLSLSDCKRDLQYLYPFRYSQRKKCCYNQLDFSYFQKKYKLTVKPQLVGVSEKSVITFRTPILYDITCMVPLFLNSSSRLPTYSQKSDDVCIVILSGNPVERGELLNELLEYGPSLFILVGDFQVTNSDSNSTLATRYLLKCKVPIHKIAKIGNGVIPDCIIESLDVANMMGTTTADYNLIVACNNDNIQQIGKFLRMWKKRSGIAKRIRYVVT